MTSDAAPGPRLAPLRRNADYLRLTIGETVSTLGGAVAAFALPLAVLALGGTTVQAGLVAAGRVLGNLCASVVSGSWADSRSRRRTMLSSLAVRAAAWSIIAALVTSAQLNVSLLAALAVVDGCAAAFFTAAEAGSLRLVVPPEQYPRAVAIIEGRQATASLIGGPVGGLLLAIRPAAPFWVNSASFVASLAGITRVRTNLDTHRATERRLLRAMKDGLRLVMGRAVFRRLVVAASISNFVLLALNFSVVLILQRSGDPYWQIGIFQAMVGCSLLVGSILAPRLVASCSVGRLVLAAAFVQAQAVALMAALYSHFIAVCLLAFVCFLLAPAANAAWVGYLALVTPLSYQGRVMAVEEILCTALLPFGTIAAGLIVAHLQWGYAFLLLALIIASEFIFLLSSTHVRRLPLLISVSEEGLDTAAVADSIDVGSEPDPKNSD